MLKHHFKVRPLTGGGYEVIPTQFLFAVAATEEAAGELVQELSDVIERFNAKEWEKVNGVS